MPDTSLPQTPIALPPPPPAAEQPKTFGMRPVAVAAATLLLAGTAAFLGFRTLWPYPPRSAGTWLIVLCVVLAGAGFGGASQPRPTTRKWAVGAVLVGAVVLPLVATSVIPGIAQPRSEPIPGGEPRVLYAAPDGTWDLYLMPHGDDGELIALTDTDDVDERWPHLSPDGSSVVYAVARPDGTSDLFLMRLAADGHPTTNDLLVSGDGRLLSPETWTPEGSLLVQVRTDDEPAAIEALDVTTGHMTPFLRNAGNLAFSPDGTETAFSRPSASDPDDWDIWVGDANGRHAEDVLALPGDQEFPDWSPDGASLLFTGWIGHRDPDVYVASADGTGLTDLTPSSRARDMSDSWTPDGHVLFLSDRSQTGGTFLYFMNADGTDVTLALRL